MLILKYTNAKRTCMCGTLTIDFANWKWNKNWDSKSLFNKQKKIAAGWTIATGWKAYDIKIPDMIKEHLESTGKILTVNEANQKFKDRYTAEEHDADDFPTEKQIKSKCTGKIAWVKR